MTNTAELNILFPTSFSDACFRTGRAIAQLADAFRVSLTIAHVARPDTAMRAQHELDSFMAEADHYEDTRRVLLQGDDPVKALASLCQEQPFDLILAPASDRLGLHSLLTRSFRARLLRKCNAPLWTAGACLGTVAFKSNIRSVACLIEAGPGNGSYLQMAAAFACRVGARLHVMQVLPSIHEGMLADGYDRSVPLMPQAAMKWIGSTLEGSRCPDVDIRIGAVSTELPDMLRRCDANLVFLGPGQSASGIRATRLARHLDRLPCPAVCFSTSVRFHRWRFQDAAENDVRSLVPVRSYAFAG